jgi:hypothetical protein
VSGFHDADATADLVGELVAVLRQLHRVLGAAAPVVAHPSVCVFLDERALEHAWQAELLVERLPRRAGFDPEVVCVLGALAPGFDLLSSLGTAGDEVGLLAGYVSLLLPFLEHLVTQLERGASPAADRALLRCLRLVRSDLDASRPAGDELLDLLVAEDGPAAHAGRVVADLGSSLGI